jgi:hypothetical protein
MIDRLRGVLGQGMGQQRAWVMQDGIWVYDMVPVMPPSKA